MRAVFSLTARTFSLLAVLSLLPDHPAESNSGSLEEAFYAFGHVTSVNPGRNLVNYHIDIKKLSALRDLPARFRQSRHLLHEWLRVELYKMGRLYIYLPEGPLTDRSGRVVEVTLTSWHLDKDMTAHGPIPPGVTLHTGTRLGYRSFSGHVAELPVNPVETTNQANALIINQKDRKAMVLVPAGHFVYGQGHNASLDNYNPDYYTGQNRPDIPAFYIHQAEVSRHQFAVFARSAGYNYPYLADLDHEQLGKLPVTRTSFRDAEAYCRWAGLKLPAEWEWEKAARGPGYSEQGQTDSRSWPWGNNWEEARCNSAQAAGQSAALAARLWPVDRLPLGGASPYGALGMCGNAPEWTDSWYSPYPGTYFRSKKMGRRFKVIRGGGSSLSRDANRVFERRYGGLPDLSNDRSAGFRCIKYVE